MLLTSVSSMTPCYIEGEFDAVVLFARAVVVVIDGLPQLGESLCFLTISLPIPQPQETVNRCEIS